MKPFEALMIVVQTLRRADGWRCVRLSNNYVVMRHDELGERKCRIRSRSVEIPDACA